MMVEDEKWMKQACDNVNDGQKQSTMGIKNILSSILFLDLS